MLLLSRLEVHWCLKCRFLLHCIWIGVLLDSRTRRDNLRHFSVDSERALCGKSGFKHFSFLNGFRFIWQLQLRAHPLDVDLRATKRPFTIMLWLYYLLFLWSTAEVFQIRKLIFTVKLIDALDLLGTVKFIRGATDRQIIMLMMRWHMRWVNDLSQRFLGHARKSLESHYNFAILV